MYQPVHFTANSFYSPTFHCYTSPAFYRELLSELEKLSVHLDKSKASLREAVWEQLFILLGAKQVPYSKPFSEIIRAWKESPTINLLAIELLYIAISIVLDKTPSVSISTSPLSPLPSDKTNLPVHKMTTSPLSSQSNAPPGRATLLPRQPPLLPVHSHPPSLATKGLLPTTSHRPISSRPPMMKSETHSNSPQNNIANLTKNVAPLSNQTQNSPNNSINNHHHNHNNNNQNNNQNNTNSNSNNSNNNSNNNNNSGGDGEQKFFKQLLELQEWKSNLEVLPSDKKLQIFNTISIINPNFPTPSDSSFINLINKFALSILENKQYLECLHDVIVLFIKNGTISFHDSKPSSSPSPPSPTPIKSNNTSSIYSIGSSPLALPILPPTSSLGQSSPSSHATLPVIRPIIPNDKNISSKDAILPPLTNQLNNNNRNLMQQRLTQPSKGVIPIVQRLDDNVNHNNNINNNLKRKIDEIGDIEGNPPKK